MEPSIKTLIDKLGAVVGEPPVESVGRIDDVIASFSPETLAQAERFARELGEEWS